MQEPMNTRSPATAGVDQIQPPVSTFQSTRESGGCAKLMAEMATNERARMDARYIRNASPDKSAGSRQLQICRR